MRIGILGGTFNPVHNGHIAMAIAAFEQLSLDKVLLMPTGNPPHKKEIIDGVHRLNMINLAIKKINYLEASDFELRRSGIIYTADTLSLLTSQNPNDEYTFIIGGDSFKDIEKWYHPERIMALASIAVCTRDNESIDYLVNRKIYLTEKFKASIHLLKFECIDIASRDIRETFKKELETKWLNDSISSDVKQYIIDNHLYRG